MLSEVPEGWSEKELEQLLSVSTPGFWGKEAGVEDTDILVLRATNFTKGGIRYETAALRSFPNKKIEQKKLKKGDLLLERSGGSAAQPVGRIRYFDAEGAYSFSNFFQLLRVDEAQVRSNYTYYMLDHFYKNGDTVQLQKATTGIRNLAYKDYLATKFLVPPLTEQKRIAEVLSSVDESIQATQRLIEQAERVKQGLMEELLTGGLGSEAIERGEVPEGWKAAKFIDLMTLKRGYDLPVAQRVAGSVPVVASNGQIGWHNEPKIDGPIIVTGRSGTIGKVELYWQNCHPLNTTLYSQKINGNDPLYLKYFLQYFKLERFSTGTGVPTLNRNYVHEQDIVIPTKKQQRLIAAQIAAMDAAMSANQKKIEQQRNLKKGLMDDLLTGKVRTV